MKKNLLLKIYLLTTLIFSANQAQGQFNYPRFFQQVNRSNNNRFTTGGGISYRWQQFNDTAYGDTIRILPSTFDNIISITAGLNNNDSVSHKHTLISNNGNTYLNDRMTINILLAVGDSLVLGTGFSTLNTLFEGGFRFTILCNRTGNGTWIAYSSIAEE